MAACRARGAEEEPVSRPLHCLQLLLLLLLRLGMLLRPQGRAEAA